MVKLLLLSALAALSAAQSTGITDVITAAQPTASAAPVGTQSAEISYDTAAVASSVVDALTSTTTSPTSNSEIAVPTLNSGLAHMGSFDPSILSMGNPQRRSGGALLATRNLAARDLNYPIDTSHVPVPSGYTPAFVSLNGSTQANGYMTYKTLTTYDPSLCAAACNKQSSCQFFNIYYEKDPDSNSKPVDMIKCSLYSLPQKNATATNVGQWRGSFHIIITGSNGYNKQTAPTAPKGYTLSSLSGAVDGTTTDNIGGVTLLKTISLSSYDPSLCTLACETQTQVNKNASTSGCYQTCVYANMYIQSVDGVPQSTICALYTQNWDSLATKSSYDTDSHHYDISNSIGLTNTALAATYPVACQETRSCNGVTTTCATGKSIWFPQDYRFYMGFYGHNVDGAQLQVSNDIESPNDDTLFVGSGAHVPSDYYSAPAEYGYIVDAKSSLCWTMVLSDNPGPEGAAYDNSTVVLKPCAASVVPPDNQKFASFYYSPPDKFWCLMGFPDTKYVGIPYDRPTGSSSVVRLLQDNPWCVGLAEAL